MSGNANSGRKPRPGNRCQAGHLVLGDNAYVQPKRGYTVCKECRREANRDSTRLRRAAAREAAE